MIASSYAELAPPGALGPVAACVWTQRVGERVDPVTGDYEQPVLPDGCVDLVAGDGWATVAGPATTAVTARLAPGSVTVGVRFRTGAASAVLGVAASELRDRDVPADDLWGSAATELVERCAATSAETRLALLGRFVGARLAAARHDVDELAVHVADLVARRPRLPVTELAERVGLSERQLRRRIADAVGYPPQTLASIARFQHFLAAARATDPAARDLATLAVTSGYADQAHLTRECTRRGGLPPARLLAAEERRLGVAEPAARPDRSRRPAAA